MFHRGIVTKYVVRMVKCLYFITACLNQYNGITRKPHDHLFQKCWRRGLPVFAQKIPKILESDVLPRHCNRICCHHGKLFIFHHRVLYQYNGITQKPHDHLFQKSGMRSLPVLRSKYSKFQK